LHESSTNYHRFYDSPGRVPTPPSFKSRMWTEAVALPAAVTRPPKSSRWPLDAPRRSPGSGPPRHRHQRRNSSEIWSLSSRWDWEWLLRSHSLQFLWILIQIRSDAELVGQFGSGHFD
jgi:hypothetical protein